MARARILEANGAPRWVVGKVGDVVHTYPDGAVDIRLSAEDCRSAHFRTWSFESYQAEMLPDGA